MLNNGAASKNDNYPSLGFRQYGQMTSALNSQQSGYGATNVHSKRQGQSLQPQMQMQQGLQSARRAQAQAPRAGMPANFSQYGPGARGNVPLASSNAPMMRPSQAALPSQYSLQGPTRSNLQPAATSAASVRGLGQPSGHAGLSQVHGDITYTSQGHMMSQRYGMQQPPANLQQDHTQRAHGTLSSNNRLDLAPGQHAVPTSGPGMFMSAHAQQVPASDATYRSRPGAAAAVSNQQRRVVPARVEQSVADKEGLLDSRDFPALGGLQSRGTGPADAAANGLASLTLHSNLGLGKTGGPLDSNDFPALNQGRVHGNLGVMTSGGRLMHGDGAQNAHATEAFDGGATRQASASARDEGDSYGLKGLVPQIRSESPSDNYISLGVDLNAMGLDLSSQEPLYPSLSSPWSAGGRMGEVDMPLPEWFLFEPPKLQQKSLARFSTASIMAVFYIFSGEDNQLLAAEELHKRDWVFHRTCLLWMKPKKMAKFTHDRLGEGEKGEIEYFDTVSWMIKTKEDFFLSPLCLEESPSEYAAQQGLGSTVQR